MTLAGPNESEKKRNQVSFDQYFSQLSSLLSPLDKLFSIQSFFNKTNTMNT